MSKSSSCAVVPKNKGEPENMLRDSDWETISDHSPSQQLQEIALTRSLGRKIQNLKRNYASTGTRSGTGIIKKEKTAESNITSKIGRSFCMHVLWSLEVIKQEKTETKHRSEYRRFEDIVWRREELVWREGFEIWRWWSLNTRHDKIILCYLAWLKFKYFHFFFLWLMADQLLR